MKFRFEVVPADRFALLPDALMLIEEFVAHTKRSGGLGNPYLKELVADAEGVLERADSDGGTMPAHIGDPEVAAKWTEQQSKKVKQVEDYSILERLRFLEQSFEVLERQCPEFARDLHERLDGLQKAIGPSHGPVSDGARNSERIS